MPRLAVLLMVGVHIFAACGGGSTPPTPTAPTAAGVSVQSGDLPRGMVRCDLSGDIDGFIQKERSADPNVGQTAANQWSQARTGKASAAYVAIYADSAAHCGSFKTSGTNPATATYRLVINFVTQYRDEKSAATAYSSQSIFGVSASSLRSSGSQAIEGSKTGLGANSIVISQPIATQTFYIALWQNRAFAVLLVALNFDPATSQKIATAENARIK